MKNVRANDILIRLIESNDDMSVLTHVIRSAYARLGASGLQFWATYQSVEDTRTRCAEGRCFVAIRGTHIVGTITLRPPDPASEVAVFRDASTWTIGQFAVVPELHGCGIGKLLHDAACADALRLGALNLALDTAKPAKHLIAMYTAWNYVIVGECDWRPTTNYISVVMMKSLQPEKSII